ncbi:MAG: phage head-tail connector protein [Bacteroidaceae bacterium]|nr:phage head-tail connector protein [Bacteroidaceae bacterium]
MLKIMISPDTDTDDVLSAMLSLSQSLILNKMYPFGYEDGTTVPAMYEHVQLELAVELYTRRGAEGQASHTENGITRTWTEKCRTLARVVPHVGSVKANA